MALPFDYCGLSILICLYSPSTENSIVKRVSLKPFEDSLGEGQVEMELGGPLIRWNLHRWKSCLLGKPMESSSAVGTKSGGVGGTVYLEEDSPNLLPKVGNNHTAHGTGKIKSFPLTAIKGTKQKMSPPNGFKSYPLPFPSLGSQQAELWTQ